MAIARFLMTISPALGRGMERFSTVTGFLGSDRTAAVLNILIILVGWFEVCEIDCLSRFDRRDTCNYRYHLTIDLTSHPCRDPGLSGITLGLARPLGGSTRFAIWQYGSMAVRYGSNRECKRSERINADYCFFPLP